VVAISANAPTIGKKVGGKTAAKKGLGGQGKGGLGGAKVQKVEGELREAINVPQELLHDTEESTGTKDKPSGSSSVPTTTSEQSTSRGGPQPANKFGGFGSDSATLVANNTLVPSSTYNPAQYPQREGPDYGGLGGGNNDAEPAGGGFHETMWQLGDAMRNVKEKVKKKRDAIGSKVKDFLDDL
jgi:hypothetical protein